MVASRGASFAEKKKKEKKRKKIDPREVMKFAVVTDNVSWAEIMTGGAPFLPASSSSFKELGKDKRRRRRRRA